MNIVIQQKMMNVNLDIVLENLMKRGFEELGMTTIWCGYYKGNKSKRVQKSRELYLIIQVIMYSFHF